MKRLSILTRKRKIFLNKSLFCCYFHYQLKKLQSLKVKGLVTQIYVKSNKYYWTYITEKFTNRVQVRPNLGLQKLVSKTLKLYFSVLLSLLVSFSSPSEVVFWQFKIQVVLNGLLSERFSSSNRINFPKLVLLGQACPKHMNCYLGDPQDHDQVCATFLKPKRTVLES